MRKIYLSCLSCLAGVVGLRYYFELTPLSGLFLKGYGLASLILAILLLSCYFSDLPKKLVRRLIGVSLIALLVAQFIPLSIFFSNFELNLELILPMLIIVFEVMGIFYMGVKSLIDYILLKRTRLKVK